MIRKGSSLPQLFSLTSPPIAVAPLYTVVVDDDRAFHDVLREGLHFAGFIQNPSPYAGFVALRRESVHVLLASDYRTAEAFIMKSGRPALDHIFMDDDLGAPQGLFRRTGFTLCQSVLQTTTGHRRPRHIHSIASEPHLANQLRSYVRRHGIDCTINHMGKAPAVVSRLLSFVACQHN